MKEQLSAHSTAHAASRQASSTLILAIRSIGPALVLGGVFICCAAWLYQSTPILLNALGTFLYQFAAFYVIFGSVVVIAGICLTFAYVFDVLYDRHHLHVTRRRYREMQLYLYKYEMSQHIPHYDRHQGLVNAYMHAIRYNLFYKPPA